MILAVVLGLIGLGFLVCAMITSGKMSKLEEMEEILDDEEDCE